MEDTAVQITWGSLPPGAVRASAAVGAKAVSSAELVDFSGGPGSIIIEDLRPDTTHQLTITTSIGSRQLTARTLAPPPGALLSRIATVSDLHIGARRWGFFKTMIEDGSYPELHPIRCARAAITDAVSWGAELILIKGDAVHHRQPDHFAELGRLVDEFPDVPMALIPGNHDVDYSHSKMDLPETVGSRRLPYTSGVDHLDLEGIRLVFADTTIHGRGEGTIAGVKEALLNTVAQAQQPALLAVHHHFQRHPITTYWPPGIAKDEAVPFLDELGRTATDLLVTSGHSHRNRTRIHRSAGAPITITEVASTRDWPGVWAGYAVHEGGIRQVVRRASAPDAVEWHEYSRGALLGAWDFWSPGPLDQRCFSQSWSAAG